MNILVTGAAGFIGSHFVLRHTVMQPGDAVVVLDVLGIGSNKHFLDPVQDKIAFIEGDIADGALVRKILKDHNIEAIVNFAAESHVDRSITNASPFIHSNIVGVQALIDVLRDNPSVRMLHVSTDEVYGDLTDDEAPKKRGDPLVPSSPYAASKAAGEMLLMAAMRTYNLKIAVSRCTNNFGPHQAEEKFIPTVIRHALKDEAIPIYAQGKNKRDWLYVTDHCDGLEAILATPEAFDALQPMERFFNISADDERQNIDVAKMILTILGKPESLLSFVADRPGHDWRYALDSSTTRSLGWKPKVSFEEGLKKTVDWYGQHLAS